MQLGVITDEISQDFEHALDVMLEYGVRGAELRGLWGTNIADLSREQVSRAKDALQERGMTAIGLATPFYKCDLTEEAADEPAGPLHLAAPLGLEQQMELLKRCIELAHEFETPLLRVFTFWRKQALTPELEERIVDAFDDPVNLAAQHGVTLTLENEHSCFIGTGAETARILSEFQSQNFRACWDPGNAFAAGETPFPGGYEEVKPYIAHVHIKDARIVQTAEHGPQPQWCIVGEGEIDWRGQIEALRRDDYKGWLSLETHFGGETGSRACLDALVKMI